MVEIKGTTLQVGKNMFLTIYGEETFARVVSLLSPAEQEVLNSPIWSVQWYPLDYYIHWCEAVLQEVFHGDEQAHLEQLIYPAIEAQFNLVYRAFLLFSSPESVLRQMVRITGAYFRGVTVGVEMLGPGRALLTFAGFQKRDRIIEISIRGWWEKVLETARVKNAAFEIQTSVGEGKGYGQYVIRWGNQ
jgi:hypothetical protein